MSKLSMISLFFNLKYEDEVSGFSRDTSIVKHSALFYFIS